jgi:hypothetical protein
VLNFNPQQQQPGMFPVIDELENRVHPVVRYVLGACCAVGGYVWGCGQDRVPVALCVALGLVVGLLLVPLLLKSASFLAGAALVVLAAVLTFWLLAHDAELKGRGQAAPVVQQAQPQKPRGLLDQLLPEVRP